MSGDWLREETDDPLGRALLQVGESEAKIETRTALLCWLQGLAICTPRPRSCRELAEIEKAHAVRINQGIKEQWVAGTHHSPTISSYMLGCSQEPITVSGPSPQV